MEFADFAKGSLLNLCVLLALVALSGFIRAWFGQHRRAVPRWRMGLLYGVMATIAMLFPVATRSGMIFDCRSGVIGTGALMGGPVVALASLPLPLIYRMWIGGIGLLPGLMEIVFPAVLGSCCYLWFRRRGGGLDYVRIFVSSLIAGLGTNVIIITLVHIFMPESDVQESWAIAALVLLETPIVMMVLGSLIFLEQKHFDAVEALAETERRMLHSQKMAAIGQLSRKIAHTFVNTFTTILGNAQLAKDSAGGQPDVKRHTDEIIESVGRISFLTGELLAFANPSPARMKLMDLTKGLSGIREILSKTIGPDVDITIDAAEKAGRVRIDADQIGQAIVHLAVNASEAMNDRGELTIGIHPANLTARRKQELQAGTHEKDRHKGAFAVLTVEDTGPGMSDETCLRCFEPFFTTKGRRENAGLGLSSVYNIVQLHNGYIDVRSREGRGTTFLLYFPVIDEPEE